MFQKGYIVAAEVTLPNNQRADVIAYNREGEVIIVEVKVDRTDFLNDNKWQGYLPYCHELYFLLSTDILHYFDIKKHAPAGLIIESDNTLIIKCNASHNSMNQVTHGELIFSINKNLSRKLVYGY